MILPSQYKNQLAQAVAAAAAANEFDENIVADAAHLLERPRAQAHGDLSCPLPLVLAKKLRANPRAIAEKIAAAMQLPPFVADVQIAAAGFINFTIAAEAKVLVVNEILSAGEQYGRQPPGNESILLEFVSANPTGPLHVGHGRACVYGDALANILTASGVDVRREYYVNDAGRQMDILAASVWLRYWNGQNADGAANLPEGAYRGDYLIEIAEKLSSVLENTQAPAASLPAEMTAAGNADSAADILLAAARRAMTTAEAFNTLRRQVGEAMLEGVIKKDMQALNVAVKDIAFFRESALHHEGRVAAAIQMLQERGWLYEKDGALWFKSSEFADEKDRVVRRANTELTYFAADIAYHADKLSRPHPPQNRYKIINVLGADHHGYTARLSAAMQALGFAADSMETRIIQFVTLLEDGKRLKMSTRAGEFVTLQQLVEAVGCEAARYYYLNRKNDQHLDFDLAVARAQDRKNPIYYLHYASARVHRVIEHWIEHWEGERATLAAAAVDSLAADESAVRLCGGLLLYPETLARAADERAPHLLTIYMHELTAQLHNYYENTRILPQRNASPDAGMSARLALLQAAITVLNNAAKLLGLRLPKKL